MSWLQIIRDRILGNLAAASISEFAKEDIVQQAVEDTEAGRAFGAQPEESKRKEDEPLVRGEKLSDLRARARKWAGWGLNS